MRAFSDRKTSSRVASSTRYDAFSRRISSHGSLDGNGAGFPWNFSSAATISFSFGREGMWRE